MERYSLCKWDNLLCVIQEIGLTQITDSLMIFDIMTIITGQLLVRSSLRVTVSVAFRMFSYYVSIWVLPGCLISFPVPKNMPATELATLSCP